MANQNQITHINVGLRTKESEHIEHNWQALDINNLTFPHGKIICMFGGNNTNHPEEANGNAKIIDNLLTAENRKKSKIYAFSYDTEPLKNQNFLSKDYEDELHVLFAKSFLPLILDNKGNLKDVHGIEKAFQKLVLTSHCGGSYFANLIIDDFYNVLVHKFPEATAELLINKIQYFSYAPLEIPAHNVNALIIAPFSDINHSWSKVLELAESEKVDNDYPKHIVKQLLKAKSSFKIGPTLDDTFLGTRAIVLKIGKSTFMIPGRMNPKLNIGDHSIECISKAHILNSNTELAATAQAANYASKTIMNSFVSDKPFDAKLFFSKVTKKLEENPPASQKAF